MTLTAKHAAATRAATKAHRQPRLPAKRSTLAPPPPVPSRLTAGSHLVAIQAKLVVGAPDDAFEKEADRVADKILRLPDSALPGPSDPDDDEPRASLNAATSLQRTCTECAEDEDLQLQRMAAPRAATVPAIQRLCAECEEEEGTEVVQRAPRPGPALVPPAHAAQFRTFEGSGRPLPAGERAFFEQRFGTDFGDVRIHTGRASNDATRAIAARAFTMGRQIVFGRGEFAPGTAAGRRLLAHELTHVVQQGAAGRRIQRTIVRDLGGPETERELPALDCSRFPERLVRDPVERARRLRQLLDMYRQMQRSIRRTREAVERDEIDEEFARALTRMMRDTWRNFVRYDFPEEVLGSEEDMMNRIRCALQQLGSRGGRLLNPR